MDVLKIILRIECLSAPSPSALAGACPSLAPFPPPPGDSTGTAQPPGRKPILIKFIPGRDGGATSARVIAAEDAHRHAEQDSQSRSRDGNVSRCTRRIPGWDRVEGGGRANVGVQYTAQANRGGFVNAMFGQSYQLFGLNSYAVGDATNTGLGSGLDTARSDYVARVSFQPDRTYTFTTRYRFDESTFAVRRFEAESRANYDRWMVSLLYGNYAAQPQLGYLTKREGILTTTSFKITTNWMASAGIRYDLDAHQVDQTVFGVGYIDDCFILALNYISPVATPVEAKASILGGSPTEGSYRQVNACGVVTRRGDLLLFASSEEPHPTPPSRACAQLHCVDDRGGPCRMDGIRASSRDTSLHPVSHSPT